MNKCAARGSDVEERRSVKIKSVSNHQDVLKKLKSKDQLTLIQMKKCWWLHRQRQKVLMGFPIDLPRPSQVYNCDEIGFDPNISWIRVVCTYKFFTGKRICKPQTRQRDPFWCTALIFTRADGQCFMSPVIVHRAENYTYRLHWNLPSDWLGPQHAITGIYGQIWLYEVNESLQQDLWSQQSQSTHPLL